MPDRRIIEWIVKDIQGKSSVAEQKALTDWLQEDPAHQEMYDGIRHGKDLVKGTVAYRRALERQKRVGKRVLRTAMRQIRGETPMIKMKWWLAAASVVFLLAGGGWWWMAQRDSRITAPNLSARENLAPGGNKAKLILADKKEVLLDQAAKGAIALEGDVHVTKTDTGEIAYKIEIHNQASNGKPGLDYNVMITPRGGQYKLRLSDGTTVYMNAQSSLRFPVTFSDQERKVFLEGEAYFEVASDPGRPFKVELGPGREITVLGTRFEIQDYADDSAAASILLEGKIKVATNSSEIILAPNERVNWNSTGTPTREKDEMADASIAWTRGLFRFRNAPLNKVMRQLSRWYDLDVEFQGAPPDVLVTASISRNTNAWNVLDAIKEIAGVNYRVEGRKVTVLR